MRDFKVLTIADVHAHVCKAVDAAFSARDFQSMKPLQWVDSSSKPIRRIFEYWQLKGGVVAPRWGYSFDFVPHLSGGKLKWHRTEKSALLDVFVDGQSSDLNLSYMWGESGLLDGLQERVAAGATLAKDFWDAARTPSEVFNQVTSLAGRTGSQFQTQLPITAAICHALEGREEQGRKEFDYYIAHRKPHADAVPKLQQIFEEALRGGFDENTA